MKRVILTLLTILSLAVMPAAVLSGNALAAPACPGVKDNSAQDQILDGINETGANCDDRQVNRTLATVVTILSLIVGIAAVIVIIFAGFKYVTAGGEASKVGNAKNTLIYALVGLIIAALAQLLVHFVLTQAGNSNPNCITNSKIKSNDRRCK